MRAVHLPNEDEASETFDEAFFGHIGFTLSNAARSLFLGLGGARFLPAPGGVRTRPYFRQFSRMSAAFALTADFAMLTLGGSLKRKEKLSGRLADILSYLYLGSATLKRYEDEGQHREDAALMQWSCDDLLFRTQEQLLGLLANFPNRPVAWLLRALVFPLGRSYAAPTDRLGHQVVGVLLKPSLARDRLTAGVFTTYDTNEAIGQIEDALVKVCDIEGIEKKIQAAIRAGQLTKADESTLLEQGLAHGVINDTEVAQFRAAIAARREVIQVDAFPQGFWK
jgi:acyl-CoA dehydrogenase